VQENKSILRGVSEMVLKKIKVYDAQSLYNTVEYFSQYNQNEMLFWYLQSIYKKFPMAKDGVKQPENPDTQILQKMAALAMRNVQNIKSK
jgi:hypothetical protein